MKIGCGKRAAMSVHCPKIQPRLVMRDRFAPTQTTTRDPISRKKRHKIAQRQSDEMEQMFIKLAEQLHMARTNSATRVDTIQVCHDPKAVSRSDLNISEQYFEKRREVLSLHYIRS